MLCCFFRKLIMCVVCNLCQCVNEHVYLSHTADTRAALSVSWLLATEPLKLNKRTGAGRGDSNSTTQWSGRKEAIVGSIQRKDGGWESLVITGWMWTQVIPLTQDWWRTDTLTGSWSHQWSPDQSCRRRSELLSSYWEGSVHPCSCSTLNNWHIL